MLSLNNNIAHPIIKHNPPIGVIIPKNEYLYIDIKYNEPENNRKHYKNRYATVFNSKLNILAINPTKINPIA